MTAKSRIDWLILKARRQIWFRAAIIAAGSVIVAAFAGPLARFVPYEFTGEVGQSAVGTILQIIASSMLAVTTFSLTAMVGAYSSATQIGTPRATQLMISDRTSQNALSTFLGAFIFSVVGIIGLQTDLYGGQGRVVLLLATIVLIALVVVTLLRWIAHLAAFGRMADVIDRVEDAARHAMRAYADDPFSGGRRAVPVPPGAQAIPPGRIGYVTHVDVAALGRVAEKHGLTVHVAARPGALVHGDRPLMQVEGPADDAVRAALTRAFTIERHRSFDHDPRLGVIALAEIAIRALSPAVNDPGTAIEVLNALLRTLSLLPPDRPDPAGRPRVHVAPIAMQDFLDDGFLPIIRDGAKDAEAAIRTLKVLDALRRTTPQAGAIVGELIAVLGDAADRDMADPAARRRLAAAEDACAARQG